MTRTHRGYSRVTEAVSAVLVSAAAVLFALVATPAAATVGKPGPTTTGINSNHFGPHTPDNCTIIIKPPVTFTASGNIMDATGLPARIRIL